MPLWARGITEEVFSQGVQKVEAGGMKIKANGRDVRSLLFMDDTTLVAGHLKRGVNVG